MFRRLSTLVGSKRAPHRTRENVEDRSRYYDMDNAVASSRPRSPLIDRQCLSPAAERQLQNACLFLSQKIEFPSRWTEFEDPCADHMDASPSSSHFPDLKISSFTIPEHIASVVNGDPAPGSDRSLNEHDSGTLDPEDKMCVDLKEKQELTHGYFVDAFEPERSTVPLTVEEVGKISSSTYEPSFPSHLSREQNPSHESTNLMVENWKDSTSREFPYGISCANDMTTDIRTIQECTTAKMERVDTRLHNSSTLPQSVNRESHPMASSENRSTSPHEQQIMANSQVEGSDRLASPALKNNNPLDTNLQSQTEPPAKQIFKINTNLSPMFDAQTERDLSISPLSYAQSWTSRSPTASKTIIDANGLEKVMTPIEEQQRRLGLQRAVMEKMSGGCTVPTSPNTNRAAAAIHSNFSPIKPTAPTSPTWGMASTKEQSTTYRPADTNKLDEQTKTTLVRKLSRLTLGKKKSVPKMNNVLGFNAIVEAR
ncbi:hypothetical protein GX51_06239 [Blastomyces parvus]|uniref:Uncharacterized protein n=1 Tax=Blastomyces parvus TaxID=2060905 RepID=A0A2B7WT07_9EURO|nr:hypothetical protein GX51_06239 [Blastomyces parvus]